MSDKENLYDEVMGVQDRKIINFSDRVLIKERERPVRQDDEISEQESSNDENQESESSNENKPKEDKPKSDFKLNISDIIYILIVVAIIAGIFVGAYWLFNNVSPASKVEDFTDILK